MSRSRRKTPIAGYATAESEAQDKRIWHKRARAMQRQRLHWDGDPLPVQPNEAINPWAMGKDGKCWMPEHEEVWRK